MLASPVAVARRYFFVRETEGPNDGTWVSFFQRFTGNRPGDSWCASFLSVILDIVYKGIPPVKRSASCQQILEECSRKGFIALADGKPETNDLFFYLDLQGRAHHIGVVTLVDVRGVFGIAGNTSEDGASVNGTGVFEHRLTVERIVYARLPR